MILMCLSSFSLCVLTLEMSKNDQENILTRTFLQPKYAWSDGVNQLLYNNTCYTLLLLRHIPIILYTWQSYVSCMYHCLVVKAYW